MQSKIVILGTGGTIAGTAASADDAIGYTAATLSIQQLVNAVPALVGLSLECEQVAQVDSKDMDYATWQKLAQRCDFHLARSEVAGVVVTHGTDTLEETAYFLHRVLSPRKPLVLTAAMRPATSDEADGPRNLADAVAVARSGRSMGVSVVMAGNVWPALGVRKRHTHRLDAFDGGDRPVAATASAALGLGIVACPAADWPRVEIVLNHVGANGSVVDALVESGVDGIVAAGTGNGTLSSALLGALARAAATGVHVLRASRCADGPVSEVDATGLAGSGPLSAVQARVELLLRLLAIRPVSGTAPKG